MDIFLHSAPGYRILTYESLNKHDNLGAKEKYWLLKKCELTERSVNGKFG